MLKFAIFLCAAGSQLQLSAASPAIGFAKSSGDFLVDGSLVRGNSTVFEGTLIETAAARSVIQLSDAQITLAPGSRLRVYHDRSTLEKGTGSLTDSAHYTMVAATLRIAPSSLASMVQIELNGPLALTVAARGGPAEVRDSSNALTANLPPGTTLAFEPQAAPATVVKMTGLVESRDGAYFLTDDTTKVPVQIEGANVPKYVGKTVQITGTTVPDATPVGGASQLVHIAAIKLVAGGAAAAGTGGAAAGGSSAGLSGLAIGAIVGGVAIAATVGGLAASGTFNGSSVSRP